MTFSDRLKHFFHVVSNVRPIVWIGLYVALTPVFAFIYWALPDSQFRIPDGAPTDYGSWLYYSIVTITTLGFGDYTPAHGWAQGVTAIEVMCGLIFLGLFLNAVGSMKSEIDVASEIEKQKILHQNSEHEKIKKSTPTILHVINIFLAYCYAVTTPVSKRNSEDSEFNPDFNFSDMADLYKPSGLSIDHSGRPAIEGLIKSASRTSLCLDSLQNRIDLTIWPDLLEDCFAFVANYQIFASSEVFNSHVSKLLPDDSNLTNKDAEERISKFIAESNGTVPDNSEELQPLSELFTFIKENGKLARNIEIYLTKITA